MTLIRFRPLDGAGQPITDVDGKKKWRFEYAPAKRYVVPGGEVLRKPAVVLVGDGDVTAEVPPSPAGNAVTFSEKFPGGRSRRTVLVPDSASVVDYEDLVDVDPASLSPVEEPGPAWAVALDGRVAKGALRINVADYPSAKAAVAAAPAGSTIYFPPGNYMSPSGLGNGIVALADDLTFELSAGAEIQVLTWGQPGIDLVNRKGCRVGGGGRIRYIGIRGNHLGNSGRSNSLYTNACGVYINNDDNTVDDLRVIDMAVGVTLSSWRGTSAVDARNRGNTVSRLKVSGANFGVLFTAEEDFTIDRLMVRDDNDDSGGANPTHAIYCTATTGFRSSGVTISNCLAKNILGGQPYQLKFCDDVKMTNLIARACRGFMNIIGCVDLALSTSGATGCLPSLVAPLGALTVQGTGAQRHRYKDVTIVADQVTGVDHRAVLIDAIDSTIDGLMVVSKRTSTAQQSVGIVQVRGDNNTIRDLSVTENGVPCIGLMLGGSSISTLGTKVDGIRATGVIRAVDLYGPASGVIRYERALVSASGGFSSVQQGTPAFAVYQDDILTVAGSPEGAVSAPMGRVASRSDGGAGNSLYVKEAGSGATGWKPLSGPLPPDVQVFTESGTWTKPTGGYTTAEVIAIGGGGGGGSGRRAGSGVRCGGGGGGGGSRSELTIPLTALPATVPVTVGAGGAGGAAVTAEDTSGAAGAAGGSSVFGSFLRAGPGNPGAGGTATAGAGGQGGFGTSPGGTGAAASTTGAAGASPGSNTGGGQGGASGGGITSAGAAANGGAGYASWAVGSTAVAGGVVDGSAPAAAAAGIAGAAVPGGSGGGAAASITAAAQAGAAGGIYGAGGSGGGASTTGFASGAGGAGAAGIVVVICR